MKTFYEILSEKINIPLVYLSHVGENTPKPPFMVYEATGQSRFLADNTIYDKENLYRVEYYFKNKDIELEDEIEKTFLECGYIYTKSEDIHINEENISYIVYEV